MSGKIVYEPERPHECEGYQDVVNVPQGTIWQCDECGAKWTYTTSLFDFAYSVLRWRKNFVF